MYNGIGLPSARGSGTNGFVQKNMAHVSKLHQMRPNIINEPHENADRNTRSELIIHQKKREIEAKCFRLRNELESEGLSPKRVEAEIVAYRERKLSELVLSTNEEAKAKKK